MKPSLKWPLIIAAVFTVVRVVVERAGKPALGSAFSVVALCVIVFPVLFAIQIANSSSTRPYRDHFKITTIYAVLVRLMQVPVYWLAYYYQWDARRFMGEGGVVGEGITAIQAVIVPFVLVVVWTIAAIVIGGGVGSAIIAIKRRSA